MGGGLLVDGCSSSKQEGELALREGQLNCFPAFLSTGFELVL